MFIYRLVTEQTPSF